MDNILRLFIIVGTLIFAYIIINMVNKRKLQLRYTLTWIIASIMFIIMAIFPGIIDFVADVLHIIEPVNALFLIMIFLLMLIIFSLTKAVSSYSNKVKDLTQELGMLKNFIEEYKKVGKNIND